MKKADSVVIDGATIRIQRSSRRSKTITLRQEAGGAVLMVPVGLTAEEELDSARKLWRRLRLRREPLHDADLERMARQLNSEYFGGSLTWNSIAYSDRQEKRFGSCTPSLGTIRISSRVRTLPLFVQRYVVVHELAHLLHPDHSPGFWHTVSAYPLTERARGYLMALGMEDDSTLPAGQAD